MRNHFLGALIALASLAVAPANAAIVIDAANIGQTFSVNFTGSVNGSPTNLISATQTFTLANITNGGLNYVFSVDTSNTSSVDARLRSFGFNVSPDITSVSSTGTYPFTGLSTNYPESFGVVDVCFQPTSNGTCTGGSDGLTSGQSGNTIVTLGFGTVLSSITLDSFVTRFQSIDPEINGSSSGIGVGTVTTAVPEPATWAMMLVGFGLVGASLRRRRQDATVIFA